MRDKAALYTVNAESGLPRARVGQRRGAIAVEKAGRLNGSSDKLLSILVRYPPPKSIFL
jgi:hypothetical protein